MKQPDSQLLEFLQLTPDEIRPKPKHEKRTDKEKLLVLADLHEPYGNADVYDAIENNHMDADRLLIAGDAVDFYSKSRFRKTAHVSFRDECRAAVLRLKWLSERWKNVNLMVGNHDNRAEKKIQDLLSGNEDLLAFTERNILLRFVNLFDNISIVGHPVRNSSIALSHLTQIGDIVFTHAEISRMQASATLERISLQLHRWSNVLGLKQFRVIAQAHNHDAMKAKKGGEWWYMIPTASNPLSIGFDYVYSARMVGSPASVGYSVFYQTNGVTDNNRSGFYLL